MREGLTGVVRDIGQCVEQPGDTYDSNKQCSEVIGVCGSLVDAMSTVTPHHTEPITLSMSHNLISNITIPLSRFH